MKQVSFFPVNVFLIIVLIFSNFSLSAQRRPFDDRRIPVKVNTTGKLLSSNKLAFIVEVEVPEGWKLKVATGYASNWGKENDTTDFYLGFLKHFNYQMTEHLKAARIPLFSGYYDEGITFVQILRINNKKLPILIDAELKFFLVSEDGKYAFERKTPCLLRVSENENEKTLRVGWGENKRDIVYLKEVDKKKKLLERDDL